MYVCMTYIHTLTLTHTHTHRKQSGHFDFYADGMFDQMDVEGDEYQIKPMNCPFHVLMYRLECSRCCI